MCIVYLLEWWIWKLVLHLPLAYSSAPPFIKWSSENKSYKICILVCGLHLFSLFSSWVFPLFRTTKQKAVLCLPSHPCSSVWSDIMQLCFQSIYLHFLCRTPSLQSRVRQLLCNPLFFLDRLLGINATCQFDRKQKEYWCCNLKFKILIKINIYSLLSKWRPIKRW